jgi:5-methylthioribose kinase
VAHVADLESISDPDVRSICEKKVLKLAQEMVINPTAFSSIQDVIMAARWS